MKGESASKALAPAPDEEADGVQGPTAAKGRRPRNPVKKQKGVASARCGAWGGGQSPFTCPQIREIPHLEEISKLYHPRHLCA